MRREPCGRSCNIFYEVSIHQLNPVRRPLTYQVAQGVAISSGGSDPRKASIPVDGLTTRGPGIHQVVVVLEHEVCVQAHSALLALAQQRLATNKLDWFLEKTNNYL